jgi:LAO/AO transport system kinase
MPSAGDQKPPITADLLSNGDFQIIARAITMVENSTPGAEELLKTLPHKHIPIIGITGPPGAGKSTLADALIRKFTEDGNKTAILCIDPSSSFHTGALLGDRIRMNRWYNNPQVYIRSLSSRGLVGGLTPRIFQITDLLANAGFDNLLIETVGVGQTEVDITRLADQVVLVLVPESGDDIQTMKSGIMEIGDIFVVNKSDRPGSEQFFNSLKSSIHYQTTKSLDSIRFIKTVATEEKGVEELYFTIKENIKRNSPDHSLNLLARKAWQLMAESRMKNVDQAALLSSIQKAIEAGNFNIYRFSEDYANEIFSK